MAEIVRYGLVEAGGTKFVLGIAEGTAEQLARAPQDCIVARERVPTTTPAETLGAAVAWFAGAFAEAPPAGIGIASFGPLRLDRGAADYGHLGPTPKPHWAGADLLGAFARAFPCPVAIDTDVNAPALAEARWGAGAGSGGQDASLLYLTIGTGIGGGFMMAGGRLLHGASHPEMGHIRVPRHPDDLGFAGTCPFHGDCLEGVASGPSVTARWGASLSELPADHPAHAMIAWYLAQAIVTFQAVMEPARIVMGGGVMASPGLIGAVRAEAQRLGAGYFVSDAATAVTLPALWPDSGLLGALALALSQPALALS